MPDHSDIVLMLRDAGLRATRPRISIMAALQANPHADTESITGVVRADLGSVSHQSVYDGLRVLTAAGLLRQFQPAGSVARYELHTGDNHHHIVCRDCGTIVDADCAVGEAPCLSVPDAAGFEIGEAEVIYWGRCPQCATSVSDQQTTAREKDRRD